MELVPCLDDPESSAVGDVLACGRSWGKLSRHSWPCSTNPPRPILGCLALALGIEPSSPASPGSNIEPVL
jgi:hypothetical protein